MLFRSSPSLSLKKKNKKMAETQTRLYNIKLHPRNRRVVSDDQSFSSEKFYLSIIVNHMVHKYISSSEDDFPEQRESTAIDTFELQPNTVLSESMISEILSYMGIPIEHQPHIVNNVISFAQSMITNENYSRPLLILRIVMGTVLVENNIIIDEEAETIRAIDESMEIDMFRPVPATRSSIEALEKIRFEGLDQCMICLDKLNSAVELVTRMPCKHIYHGDCIVQWLETSNLCPVCRFQMPT